MKRIVRAAPSSSATVGPKAGDKVTVHYVGTLTSNGEEFDSSRSRGQPFEFKVGMGVITGWSEAVPTMRVGEIAKFTIASSKAYGAEGSPPKIPPDASLDFEIELLSFTDRDNVNKQGDKRVLKKVIADTDKWRKPNDTCDVEFEVRVGDGLWQRGSWLSDDRLAPCVCESLTVPASLRLGIESMPEGQVASFQLPDDDDEDYEVKLLSWTENEQCVPSTRGGVVKRVERPFKEDADADWKTPSDTTEVRVRGQIFSSDGAVVADYGAISASHEAAATDDSGTVWEIDEHEGYAGDIPVCDGAEAAIKRMKVGEVAEVRIKAEFGFSRPRHGDLAAVGSDLRARLELCALKDATPSWELKDDAKVAAVDGARGRGNKHFSRGDYARAIRRYDQAVNFGASDYDITDDECKKRLKTACDAARLNRAACYLKVKDYVNAKKDAATVVEADPDNAKALFRRAKAWLGLDEWAKARADLKKVLDLDPNSNDAKRALADISKREKAYKQHQKNLYAGRKLFKTADPRSVAKPPPPPDDDDDDDDDDHDQDPDESTPPAEAVPPPGYVPEGPAVPEADVTPAAGAE
ncbi:hypothetical protein CTAYLR_002260 [Chrysophaeum taylorii]|uniref:peptidylprolyl isomerase n=1 Tax=Chrysophaeum taylorii TaxID=2483200 RepID=A0AAD7UPK7_9STRA|nr:hypothetical protein CTAYLR_002260 [Chrysophaeum taylorii]